MKYKSKWILHLKDLKNLMTITTDYNVSLSIFSWLYTHKRSIDPESDITSAFEKGFKYQTYLEVETRVSCFDFNLSDFNLCDYFSGDIHNEQEVCKVREDCLPHRGTEMPGQGR